MQILATIGAAAAALLISAGAAAQARWTTVDGDTIKRGRETVRIHGIDAPEFYRPGCQRERDLAIAAASEVQRLLAEAERVTVKRKKTRTGNVIRDKFGRTLGVVMAGKRDVGAHLVEIGLAVPYLGSGPRKDWCAG